MTIRVLYFAPRCGGTPRRQRAHTLIEIAIALVVIGLLLGGALLPLHERYKTRHVNEAKALLEDAKAAVFAYAIRNTTAARKLVYYDGATYAINAGRPYLPCPDTDNDGLENRHEIPPTLTVVSTAALAGAFGVCEEQKGMMPWKTLGLRDADPWGNRLTYRVDAAFSDSLVGFDELTRADIFDRRKKMTLDVNGELAYALRDSRDKAGGVVCSSFDNNKTTGGCPTAKLDNILAGVVTTVALTLGARKIPGYQSVVTGEASGLIDGAVFVILSHGSNGRGAISRSGVCRSPISGAAAVLAEEVNAYYHATHPFVATGNNRNGLGCAMSADYGGLLHESLFVSAPPVTGSDWVNDDIVVWAGSNELVAFLLRGGRLPIPKPSYLPQ